MTLDDFKALNRLQGHRVHIAFTDGQEIIASLSSVSTDLDGSRHLIYDKVEWALLPHVDLGDGAAYARGEEVVSCLEIQT